MGVFRMNVISQSNEVPPFTDCDVNCHKKCEKLAANLCGVNQKLIVEALATVRRENQGGIALALDAKNSTLKNHQ